MRYTAVSFDVGGTLMRMDRDRVAREYVALAHARGAEIDLATARAMFAALDDEIPMRARQSPPLSLDDRAGEIFWKTLFADGWSRLGLARDEAAVDKLYRQFRLGGFNRVFDEVHPALQALRARGLAVGVLSNFTADCEAVLRTLGIGRYFSFFAVSAVVRAEKPARAIFEYAVHAAQRPAGEILHVGDSPHHDVEGARGAGLGAILLDRDNWYPDYSAAPRVRCLTELVDLF
jgi:putative hydrolase of the HAD superfamily